MFFTWLPELRGHVLRKYFWSVFVLIAAFGLVWGLPRILHYGAELYDIDDRLLYIIYFLHPFILFSLYVFSWGMQEYHVYRFLRETEERDVHLDRIVVPHLAKKALLRSTPRIMVSGSDTRYAIATMTSFLKKHHIFIRRDVLDILESQEEKVTFAHEMMHLKHMDMWQQMLLDVGVIMFSLYLWLCYFLFFVCLFGPEPLANAWAWLLAAIFVAALRVLYSSLCLSFSRAREYLADAGAIAVAGWEHRSDLIRAMCKLEVHHDASAFFHRMLTHLPEWCITHPHTKNRARALGILIVPRKDGLPDLVDMHAPKN